MYVQVECGDFYGPAGMSGMVVKLPPEPLITDRGVCVFVRVNEQPPPSYAKLTKMIIKIKISKGTKLNPDTRSELNP